MTTITLPRLNIRATAIHPLAVISLVALAVRLLLLGNAPLWYDESGSVWMASLPFWKMVAATAGDTHPPLYLFILWLWERVAGTGEAAVRLPSVLFSLLCVPLAYAIARRLELGRTTALAAAGLVAVLPAQLHYAQEARMYALLSLAVAVALWAALARRWWLVGLALAAGFWTHNYGLLFAVPVGAVGLWQIIEHRAERKIGAEVLWLAWAGVGAVAAWFPWMFVLIGQMRAVTAGYWLQPVTAGTVLYTLHMITWGYSPNENLQAHEALLAFVAFAFAAWRARRSAGAVKVLAFLVIAFAVPVGVSVVWKPIMLFRGMMPASLALCILLAQAVSDGLAVSRRWVVALAAGPLLLLGAVFYFINVPALKGDLEVFEPIRFRAGDVIYHVNDSSLVTGHFYLPAAWPQFELPQAWHDVGAMSPATRTAMNFPLADLHSLTWRRAWLIHGATPMTAAAEDAAVEALLAEYPHQLVFEQSTDGLSRVVLYLLWNHGVALQ